MAVHIVVVLFISGGLGGWCQILKGMCASFLLEGIYPLKRFWDSNYLHAYLDLYGFSIEIYSKPVKSNQNMYYY